MDRRQFLKASVAVTAATAVGVKAEESIPVSNVQPEDVKWTADLPQPSKIRAIFISPDGNPVAEADCETFWLEHNQTMKLVTKLESGSDTLTVSKMRLVPGPGAAVTDRVICASPAAECNLAGRWLDCGGTAPVLLTPNTTLTVEYPIYIEVPSLRELL